ncbi:MAG: amidohydrolase [Verrucomicrobiales bacterium]|nr:amidohydrolase [Verrucomicrobiales bacterium]
MNRRQALETLPAITLAGCATLAEKQTGWIDAHSHVWTRDILSFPLASGRTLDDLAPPSFSAEDLIKLGHSEGVTRHVIISHQRYHGFSNDYYIHAAETHPGTFAIVGALDPSLPGIPQRMRANRARHITGYRIKPNGNPRWLEHPGLRQMWRTGAEANIAMCPLINPEHIAGLDLMCAKFQDTPVVIDHCARIDQQHTEELNTLCRLARHPNVHVKISAFYAFGTRKPPYLEQLPRIQRLLEAYGSSRLMWASDCPYQLNEPNNYTASISLVRDQLQGITPADRENLLRNTARNIFFK